MPSAPAWAARVSRRRSRERLAEAGFNDLSTSFVLAKPHPLERPGNVRSVVDGFVDFGECHVGAKPAPSRIRTTVPGSASENGSSVSGAGGRAPSSPASDCSISTDHSFRS